MQSRELHREQQPGDVRIRITSGPRRGLCADLTSGAEIEHLELCYEPSAGTGAALGKAIKCSGKLSCITVSNLGTADRTTSEVSRLLSVSRNAVLERLKIDCLANKMLAEYAPWKNMRAHREIKQRCRVEAGDRCGIQKETAADHTQ